MCSRRCRDRAQVSRITLPYACDVAHDIGERIEASKGECVREDGNDTYVCCLLSLLG